MSVGRIQNLVLGIGVGRAGSTWLYEMLRHHPDIYMTPMKELNFFNNIKSGGGKIIRRKRLRRAIKRLKYPFQGGHPGVDELVWFGKYVFGRAGDRWYASLFSAGRGRRWVGEVTPSYAILGEKSYRHIYRVAPDARLILMMRCPVERSWSHLFMSIRLGMASRDILDDENALRDFFQSRSIVSRCDYATILNTVTSVYPQQQCLPVFLEDVEADPHEELTKICNFLSVPYNKVVFPNARKNINSRSKTSRSDDLTAWMVEHYRPLAHRAILRVGHAPEHWLQRYGQPEVSDRR